MKKKIIYQPNIGETALLILLGLGKGFFESFWPHPYYHTFCKHKKKESFRVALHRLEKRGFILGERQKNKIIFSLSAEGEKFARSIKLKLKFAKRRKWDGKWRLLIFDIPERMRGKRDLFRKELRTFGFYPLQKSVWAYPYALPPEFFELWEEMKFGEEVLLVEVSYFKGDEKLKDFFGL